VPYGEQPPQVSRDDQQSSSADQIVFALASMLGGVAAGFAGGAIWAAVATTPAAIVTRRGVFLASEIGYDQRATESLWFLAVGVLGGVVAGSAVGLLGRRHGPASVVAAVLASVVAAALAAWSGIHVFGPDLTAQLAGAAPGDEVHTALVVTSDVAYLGWPIGVLIGVIIVVAALPGEAVKTIRHGPDVG
jgi:hypothetical protein